MLTFTCSAVNIEEAIFGWLFNTADLFAFHTLDQSFMYPLNVQPLNRTYDTILGGIKIRISEAIFGRRFTVISTMKANFSRLQAGGVSGVQCGTFVARSSLSLKYSNGGLLIVFTHKPLNLI